MDESTIRSELRAKGYNLSKTARALGLDYNELKEGYGPVVEPITRPQYSMPTDVGTLGKPGMQGFVVAAKAHGDPNWPYRFYNAIQRARSLYDAGTHEMCQEKRRDGWIVLYLIPRREPAHRAKYFNFSY